MTPTECSTFLRKYNEWRRGDAEDNRESEMPHPREIGVAIDAAIQLIEQRTDFREMREMLRAMQAGELTVSRGVEILEMWHAGNWNNDTLPPVRQDLIEEESMPVEIIDRITKQRDELLAALERVKGMLSETHQQMTAKANNNPDFVKSSTLEMFAIELEEPIMCCNQAIARAKGGA